MCNADVLLLPGTEQIFKVKWIYMLYFLLIIKYCIYKYPCNYMEITLQNYDRTWVTIVASRSWPEVKGRLIFLYIFCCIINFFHVLILLFKKQQGKISMTISPYLVNCEEYFLFLEFVFSDIPKVAFQF